MNNVDNFYDSKYSYEKIIIGNRPYAGIFGLSAQNGLVKMWADVETLPTYRVNAPEKAPLFERDFAYQRSSSAMTIFGLIII